MGEALDDAYAAAVRELDEAARTASAPRRAAMERPLADHPQLAPRAAELRAKPNVEVTRIEAPWPDDRPLAAQRHEALAAALAGVKGDVVNTDVGGPIRVSRQGIKEIGRWAGSGDELSLLPALPDLLRRAVLGYVTADKHGRREVQRALRLFAPVELGGRPMRAVLTVLEDRRGERVLHALALEPLEKRPAPPAAGVHTPGTRSLPDVSHPPAATWSIDALLPEIKAGPRLAPASEWRQKADAAWSAWQSYRRSRGYGTQQTNPALIEADAEHSRLEAEYKRLRKIATGLETKQGNARTAEAASAKAGEGVFTPDVMTYLPAAEVPAPLRLWQQRYARILLERAEDPGKRNSASRR